MSTGTELNNLANCKNNQVGYNATKGCPYNFKNTIAIWRTSASFQFDDTQEFNEAYIKSLQLSGDLSIIKGITDFPETGTEALVETLPDNTEISAGDAKYKYSPVFASADLYFNKLLGFLEGQENNRFIFIDSAGNILRTKGSSDESSRGLLTSRTERGKFTLQSPGVGQKATLEFQLANTYELVDNFVFISNESLDFDPRLVEPITQADIDFSSVPSDTDTSILVQALESRGRSNFINGATNVSDWTVLVNGTEVILASAINANDIYTLSIPALATGDIVEVSFNGVIDIIGDGLYRSFTASKTTVA